MSNRPTPAQDHAVSVVESSPGILQYKLAKIVGPHGSNGFGTRTLMRAVANGRLVRVPAISPANGQRCWHYFVPENVAS